MAGKKRTANGHVKPHIELRQPAGDVTMAEPTPPCGQPQPPSSKKTESQTTTESQKEAQRPGSKAQEAEVAPKPAQPSLKPHSTNRKKRQKMQRLPDHVSITKRPLLHPALPTPYASSASPKVLYITASSPYIPTLKRIRKLLSEITKREKQSHASLQKARGRSGNYAQANGRLEARDVERGIAEEVRGKEGGQGGEMVYLKATGRAIPRALEIGVHFQGEQDCTVRVEMGSVCAVDDMEVDGKQGVEGEEGGKNGEEEEIPETRIRSLSSVTISVELK